MFIGRMVGNKVEDDLEVALVGLLHQSIQVLERPKKRMDVDVVANVITEIRHRGRIDGGEPDGINAEPAEVVQLARNAGNVSHAIAIAIEKAAWVDLVKYACLPPEVCLCHLSIPLTTVDCFNKYIPRVPVSLI